jgi:hypothetical protein
VISDRKNASQTSLVKAGLMAGAALASHETGATDLSNYFFSYLTRLKTLFRFAPAIHSAFVTQRVNVELLLPA